MTYVKIVSLISIAVAVISLLYRKHSTDSADRLYPILTGLLRAEKKIHLHDVKIALGFGGCKDIFVEAMPLFEKLNFEPPEMSKHFDSVETKEDISQLYSSLMEQQQSKN